MPGCAPASAASRNTALASSSPLAHSTMPCETPKRILRGARLAITTTRRPVSCSGAIGGADAGEHRALLAAQIQRQPQQLVGALHQLGLRPRARRAGRAWRNPRCRRSAGATLAPAVALGGWLRRSARARRRRRLALDQRGHRRRVQPRRQRLIGCDRAAEQRRRDGAPVARSSVPRNAAARLRHAAAVPVPDSSSAPGTDSGPGWRWRAPPRRAPDPWPAPRACADRCSGWPDRPAP